MRRFEQALRERGFKSTSQRDDIARVFFGAAGHLSIEELYTAVKKVNPRVGYATVYRTLKLLKEVGLAAERHFDDGQARFEPVEGESQHHDHIICERCGKIVEFASQELERLQDRIGRFSASWWGATAWSSTASAPSAARAGGARPVPSTACTASDAGDAGADLRLAAVSPGGLRSRTRASRTGWCTRGAHVAGHLGSTAEGGQDGFELIPRPRVLTAAGHPCEIERRFQLAAVLMRPPRLLLAALLLALAATVRAEERSVALAVAEHGFAPPEIEAAAGERLRLEVTTRPRRRSSSRASS